MFQDVLFVPERNIRARAAALPFSILVHGLLVLMLAIPPLVRIGSLPGVELTGVFLAPAPSVPPPAPPAARGRPAAARTRIKPVRAANGAYPGPLVAPVEIPESVADEPLDAGGWGDGIEGGVDYGDNAAYGNRSPFPAAWLVIAPGAEDVPAPAVRAAIPPRLRKRVEPVYPEIARQARVEGVVVLEATTDMYGRVLEVRILRSVPLLDQAAVDAVRQWTYEPLVVNGRSRGGAFTVTLRFVLK